MAKLRDLSLPIMPWDCMPRILFLDFYLHILIINTEVHNFKLCMLLNEPASELGIFYHKGKKYIKYNSRIQGYSLYVINNANFLVNALYLIACL